MNKINELFSRKKNNLLNIFFTAGYPNLDDTQKIILELNRLEVDLIEVGIPYSDPLADGETIQETGKVALQNGMNLNILFQQLSEIKNNIKTPIILMGYFNQFLQFNPELFLKKCKDTGVSGLILPDMPLQIFINKYKQLFEKYDILISFLVTPQTSENRIKLIADNSNSFVYVVSSASTTGNKNEINDNQIEYFKKIDSVIKDKIKLIGFGIHDKKSFEMACKYSNGAIIGSAFLKSLSQNDNIQLSIKNFIDSIKN